MTDVDTSTLDLDVAREALQSIRDRARQADYRPNREWANEYQRGWHDGHVTAFSSASIIAGKALDPEGAAEVDRIHALAARGSDLDWYRETGYCGGCATISDCCQCDGSCGCWPAHGAPERPWESPSDRAFRQRNELLGIIDRLQLTAELPECQTPQMALDIIGGVDERPCGSCDVCHLRDLLGEVSS